MQFISRLSSLASRKVGIPRRDLEVEWSANPVLVSLCYYPHTVT
jgi:hypothetical protein